jgi:uncharacterized membrane protein YGL010W
MSLTEPRPKPPLLDCSALFADYGAYHRTAGNIGCHSVGIPLIIYGIFVFLRHAALPGDAFGVALSGAEILFAVGAVYYLILDLRLGTLMVPIAAFLLFLAHRYPGWAAGLAAFVVGWIFQGIGHAVFEKKSPAFMKNAIHLLVGPLFLLNEGVRFRRKK